MTHDLIHALIIIDGKEQETWISVSENFRESNEEKMAYDLFYDLQKEDNESPLEFAIRNGWGLYMYQMFCIDYLIANRDRHGSNLEVLRYNLSLIPQEFDLKINSLKAEQKDYIFHDVEKVLSEKHIDKIWEMIWKRWCYSDEICNKKK